jgi:hypothetical protein
MPRKAKLIPAFVFKHMQKPSFVLNKISKLISGTEGAWFNFLRTRNIINGV